MKKDSALTRMNIFEESLHEEDKRKHPERHWLMQDSYLRNEILEMCLECADHYEWHKELQYSPRTDRYYKKLPLSNINEI